MNIIKTLDKVNTLFKMPIKGIIHAKLMRAKSYGTTKKSRSNYTPPKDERTTVSKNSFKTIRYDNYGGSPTPHRLRV